MEKKEFLALSLIVVVVSTAVSLAMNLASDQVSLQTRNIYSEGFNIARQLTPTNSFPYGYRLAQENGSITTVGATRANTTAQSASITSSVTRETTHVLLLVKYQGNATGDSVDVWTKASMTTKYTIYSPIASKNVTQIVILPFSYSTDGKVYWDMSNGNLNHAVTIYLWGYFERGIGTVK